MSDFKQWSSQRGERKSSGKGKDRKPRKKDFRRDSGRRSFNKIEKTTVTCDSCKGKCEVPFKPRSNKPVYCSDCFKKDSSSKKSGRDNELKEINSKLNRILELLEMEE